jgi:hypothetical protein
LKGGNQKGGGLAGPRLGLAGHIVPRQGDGERLGLDRRTADKPGVRETLQNALVELEGIERDVR